MHQCTKPHTCVLTCECPAFQWHCHLLPPLSQGTPSGPQLTPCLSLLLSMGCPPQPPLLGSWPIHADCCPWAWRGCPGLREGRELGTSRTWAPWGLQGGGGRQETRSLVSIPSLPFSWEVGHRGGAGGPLAPLESVCIKQSGPLKLSFKTNVCSKLAVLVSQHSTISP